MNSFSQTLPLYPFKLHYHVVSMLLGMYLRPFAARSTLRNLKVALPQILMYDKGDDTKTQKIKDFYLGKYPTFSFSGFETLGNLSQVV